MLACSAAAVWRRQLLVLSNFVFRAPSATVPMNRAAAASACGALGEHVAERVILEWA